MKYFNKIFSVTFFLLATSYLTKGQDHEIPGVLISNAYTDNSSPMVGCDEFNVCVFLINITYPFLTFNDAIIQMHLDLDKYEIVDAGPFTNTNQSNVNGETIFETIQEIMSINDPNWQGPSDGTYRLCIKVRAKSSTLPKSGVYVDIDLDGSLKLEYDSGFLNIFNIINEIGTDINSVCTLSVIGIKQNSTLADGLLLTPLMACGGTSGPYEPQTFVLHGTLIVDIDYCFSGRIYMDDGASILIKPSVVCNIGWDQTPNITTYIDACGKMWKEIVVSSESDLFIRKTEIKNGLYGTRLDGGRVFTTSETKYMNDYIGIHGRGVAVINSSEFKFEGNFRADCSNCSGLRQYNRTFAGINLESSGLQGNNVHFENLLNGVRTYHSGFQLMDCNFQDIQDYGTNNYNTFSTEIFNGKGVHSAGRPSLAKIVNSNFDGCNWGIYTKGVNCLAEDNIMTDVLTGIQLDFSPGRFFEIIDNNISAQNIGINLSWTGMIQASSVLENTISLTGSSGIGIALHEVFGQLTTVNENTVNIGPGLVGISRVNSRYDAIAYNSILSNQATAIENIGIKLEGGSDSWVLCNQLISAQQCANKGISVYQTPNNLTAGNIANGWFFDMHYVGPSTGTFFSSNELDDANHGLCLGIPGVPIGGALIGIQEHLANKWPGSYNGKAAKHYGTSADRAESLFIINSQDQQHPEYTPSNFIELVNDGWFADDYKEAIQVICPNGPGSGNFPKNFPKEEDYLIANNGFDYGENAGSKIWSARRQLYREICRQEDFDSLPLLFQNYYASQSETSVGQFEQVETGIEQAFFNVATLNEIITTWTATTDSLTQMIGSSLEDYLSETDSISKLNILSQINGYNAELDSLIELMEINYTIMKDSLNAGLALADDLNEAILTDSLYESIQKVVNRIALSKLMAHNFTFDPQQMEEIDSLAAVCSFFGGEGVYRARSLALIFGLENYRDDSLCVTTMLPRIKEQNNNDQIQSSVLSVYPNPVSHILHIFVANPDYKVEEIRILDILGNVLTKFAITSVDRSMDVDLNQINNGIYRLDVKFTNGMVNSKSFLKF